MTNMKRLLMFSVGAACLVLVLTGCHNETDEPSPPPPPKSAPMAGVSAVSSGNVTVTNPPSDCPPSGSQGGNSAAPYQVGGNPGAGPWMNAPAPSAPAAVSPSTGGQPAPNAGPLSPATAAAPTTD